MLRHNMEKGLPMSNIMENWDFLQAKPRRNHVVAPVLLLRLLQQHCCAASNPPDYHSGWLLLRRHTSHARYSDPRALR